MDQPETRAWAEWLRRSVEPRSDALRSFVGIPRDLPPAEQFAAACRAARHLTEHGGAARMDAAAPTEIVLRGQIVPAEPAAIPSALTFSLGVDLALLMARLLMAAHPGGAWTIVWKPRDHASYRNPVLVWPSGAQLDPFQFGQGFGRRLANRNLDDTYVRRLYGNWERLVSRDAGGE